MTLDILRIQFIILRSKILYQLIYWYISFLLFIFLTGNKHIFIPYSKLLHSDSVYVGVLICALGMAVFFTCIDFLSNDRLLRFSPIRLLIIIRTVVFFVFGFVICFLPSATIVDKFIVASMDEFLASIKNIDIETWRFVVFYNLQSTINSVLMQIIKRIGKSNFRYWFIGLMNKPTEEDRIFMFMDMYASTTIAEKLSHKKFSYLMQDIFNDMVVIDNYHGQIYQYVGDGAIITWNTQKGLKNNNFLKAYFAFTKILEKRNKYYERKFGVVPKFKAGIHAGKVMALQVGKIRREVSYNGDTINTASRIESMCNELKSNLLISGALYDLVSDKKGYTFKSVGDIKLKGKRKGIEIFQIKQK